VTNEIIEITTALTDIRVRKSDGWFEPVWVVGLPMSTYGYRREPWANLRIS
jgi:hypothetical protein